jgi:hypothetical protein
MKYGTPLNEASAGLPVELFIVPHAASDADNNATKVIRLRELITQSSC